MFSHLYLAICLFTLILPTQLNHKCDNCRQLVADFGRGVEDTKSGGFQGGDVVWEEEKLSVYADSELRFVEILERVCGSKEFACLSILEEFEDALEEWWRSGRKVDLFEWFCVDRAALCCLAGEFGPNCSPCYKWHGLVCSGHGKCVGDGTRGGDGVCQCDTGFTRDNCSACSHGHFQIGHDDTFSCAPCGTKCVTCDGPGDSGCVECRSGFRMSAGKCEDINECDLFDYCKDGEECVNTDGAYECRPLPSNENEGKESEDSAKVDL